MIDKQEKKENWFVAFLFFSIICFFRALPFRLTLFILGSITALIGPRLSRHDIVKSNLKLAYSEKSDKELQIIAKKFWKNIGYFAAEYLFIDKIIKPTFITRSSKIEIVGEDIFNKIKIDKNAHIFFTAHLGNFELLPIYSSRHQVNIIPLFRPPNNTYLAKKIYKLRRSYSEDLIASNQNAARKLLFLLKNKRNIGLLIDQKFNNGVDTVFFSKPVKTNPLILRLSEKMGCNIYPARCVRLPKGRYRIEVYDKFKMTYLSDGSINIAKTLQDLNDFVESWVREHPEQWMWFHKRWQL